jgi:uncharacterized protein (DUF2141 family)
MKPSSSSITVFTIAASALAAALVLFASPPAWAQDGCVQVEVQNVRPGQGQMMLAAFGSAETWRKKPLTQMRMPVGDGATMRFTVCGLAGSEVALTLFQDLDGDGRMGTNVVGIPTEPWGASGTPGTFGPTWETGRVKLDGSVIIVRMST